MIEKAKRIILAGIDRETTGQARSQLDSIKLCPAGYAEPGYDDPDSGLIALGDWHPVVVKDICQNPEMAFSQVVDDTLPLVADQLKSAGVELESLDQWGICEHCTKAVRTHSDDPYWMQFSWDKLDGTVICGDCVAEDPAEYLTWHEGRHDRFVTVPYIDPGEYGYSLLEEGFVLGDHSGDDDPLLLMKALESQGITRFIFRLDSRGRFNSNYSVLLHHTEHSKFDFDVWLAAPKDHDTARELERAVNLRVFSPDDSLDS